MTKSELKHNVEQAGSHYFERSSMKFFGDTVANYSVPKDPVKVETRSDGAVECWELKRKRPVIHGLQASAFFACDTFRRVLPRI